MSPLNVGRTLGVVSLILAAGVVAVPSAQAVPMDDFAKTKPVASSPVQVEESGETRVEYRSPQDREAFEKFGEYISYDENGIGTARIPKTQRDAFPDLAGRIDEFLEISNATVDPEGHPRFVTYGNETKVDNWGPVTKVYLSHDVISKVNKVIGAGGGVAAVIAVLPEELAAGPAGWVAAGLTVLVAAGNLCDWNDQGIIIWRAPIPNTPPVCTPQK